jgi:hypothetical protein
MTQPIEPIEGNKFYFSPWTGGAPLHLETWQGGRRMIMGVPCKIGQNIKKIALLDTAAQWSVIGGKLAQMILEEQTLSVPTHISLSLSTRLGKFKGYIHRVEVSLIAEKGFGHDLVVDGSFVIAPAWIGPMVLGFHGFLERIRFAIDPGTCNHKSAHIYFAAL